jgi:hypothetical protein
MGTHRNKNNLNTQIIKSELVDKTGKDKLDLNDDSLVEAEEADTNVEAEEADTNVEETKPKTTKPKTTKPKTTKPKTTRPKTAEEVSRKTYRQIGYRRSRSNLDRRLTEAEIIELEQQICSEKLNKSIIQLLQVSKVMMTEKNSMTRHLEGFGIPEDQQKETVCFGSWTNEPASDIIQALGIYVIRQEVKNTSANYDKQIPDWVNVEQVENGAIEYMYHDYFDADENPAYKDVELSDYNQGVNATTYEVYRATKNIHKGYDILDVRLNDIARNSSNFPSYYGWLTIQHCSSDC